jgi:preprotein translocase subunit SecD
MKQRLNVFGLSDVVIREAVDLTGNQYIVVEIAGVNEQEVKELIAKQGKFEAKVSNKTVFRGGSDVTYVCRSADCSGIDPRAGCGTLQGGGYGCGFRFSITLSQEAAQRQADATRNLGSVSQGADRFLNESLELYLDDQLVDSLRIGYELKGKPVTEVSISGSGSGDNQQLAITNSLDNMRRLQTILITGSLPVKLEIIKTDTISPVVGEKFSSNALVVAALAALAVGFVLFIQYRKITIAIPILIVVLMEIIILLGVATIIGWNIDLAGIAGIIASVGTGVNDQIIITDEALRGDQRRLFGWKEKIKSAFFIIFGAWITLVVAMLPLLFAGAGLLRGFAITTIIGVTAGVFITRPFYAAILEILTSKEQ